MVAVVQPLVEQIANLTRRIERFVETLPDGQITFFPRAGHVCAARILAELGDLRERSATLDQMAAETGVVPVTYQPEGSPSAGPAPTDCARPLLAWATTRAMPTSGVRGIYTAARGARGDNPHAIRISREPGCASSGAPGLPTHPNARFQRGGLAQDVSVVPPACPKRAGRRGARPNARVNTASGSADGG